ncbi:hypothetical protein GCM10009591_16630 [Brachybacterium tyrofermentans]
MLGDVAIHVVIEAPRNPPVDSGLAIAVRRTRCSVLFVALRTNLAVLPRAVTRLDKDEPEPKSMGEGYRNGAARPVARSGVIGRRSGDDLEPNRR